MHAFRFGRSAGKALPLLTHIFHPVTIMYLRYMYTAECQLSWGGTNSWFQICTYCKLVIQYTVK